MIGQRAVTVLHGQVQALAGADLDAPWVGALRQAARGARPIKWRSEILRRLVLEGQSQQAAAIRAGLAAQTILVLDTMAEARSLDVDIMRRGVGFPLVAGRHTGARRGANVVTERSPCQRKRPPLAPRTAFGHRGMTDQAGRDGVVLDSGGEFNIIALRATQTPDDWLTAVRFTYAGRDYEARREPRADVWRVWINHRDVGTAAIPGDVGARTVAEHVVAAFAAA
jgi:hypothetical protein